MGSRYPSRGFILRVLVVRNPISGISRAILDITVGAVVKTPDGIVNFGSVVNRPRDISDSSVGNSLVMVFICCEAFFASIVALNSETLKD